MVRDISVAMYHSLLNQPSTRFMGDVMNEPTCRICGGFFSHERKALGHSVCLWCGEELALQARKSWCVVPMNKSNYMLITNPNDLKGLNPKRTDQDLTPYKTAINELGESQW